MRLITVLAVAALGLCGQSTAHSNEAMPATEVFSLGRIHIGATTIAGVQELLGKSGTFRSGTQDESPLQICYRTESPKGRFYVLFESGPMGGFSRITGFRISRQAPALHCRLLQSPVQVGSAGNGVEIGQSREEFLSKFAIKFTSQGANLSYRAEAKRPATTEELESLKKAWPNEASYQLDVLVSIRAYFENGHLSQYEVSKIESY